MYKIKNLNSFSKELGKLVAANAGFSTKELKESITVKNIRGIVTKYIKNKNGYFYISEDMTSQICEEIHDWIIGVSLAKLAAEDKLDCYWDDKKNCMIFKEKAEQKDELA